MEKAMNSDRQLTATHPSDERLFEDVPPNRNSPVPSAPVYSESTKRALFDTLDPLPNLTDVVETFFQLSDPEQRVEQCASSAYDAEETRSLRKSKALAVQETLGEWQTTLVAIRDRLKAEQKEIAYEEHLAPDRRQRLFRRENLLNVGAAIFWGSLSVLFFYAEVQNAVTYALNTGFLETWWGAFCLVSIFILGPMSIYHFVFAKLGPVGKKNLTLFFTFVALPGSFVGIYIFAITVDELQNFDPFSGESSDASLHKLILASSLLLSAGFIATSHLFGDACSRMLNFRFQKNPRFLENAARIEEADSCRDEIIGKIAETRGITNAIKSERELYIAKSLTELEKLKCSAAWEKAANS